MRKITLRWVEDQIFVASDSGSRSFIIGKSDDVEIGWLGVKPADLLLISTSSCATWDIVEILLKQREPIEKVSVICSGEQEADPPWSFTNIHIHYIFKGSLNSKKVEKAIKLSEDKYCAVISTLRKGIVVTSDFEILE